MKIWIRYSRISTITPSTGGTSISLVTESTDRNYSGGAKVAGVSLGVYRPPGRGRRTPVS